MVLYRKKQNCLYMLISWFAKNVRCTTFNFDEIVTPLMLKTYNQLYCLNPVISLTSNDHKRESEIYLESTEV